MSTIHVTWFRYQNEPDRLGEGKKNKNKSWATWWWPPPSSLLRTCRQRRWRKKKSFGSPIHFRVFLLFSTLLQRIIDPQRTQTSAPMVACWDPREPSEAANQWRPGHKTHCLFSFYLYFSFFDDALRLIFSYFVSVGMWWVGKLLFQPAKVKTEAGPARSSTARTVQLIANDQKTKDTLLAVFTFSFPIFLFFFLNKKRRPPDQFLANLNKNPKVKF